MLMNANDLLAATDVSGAAASTGLFGGLICMCFTYLIVLAIFAVGLAGLWKMFVKAGKPGWAAIVPIYNFMVIAEIVGRDSTYGLFTLIPCAGIVFAAILFMDLAKSFGKDAAYGIGLLLLLPVFGPMLGFGDAQYRGPVVPPGGGQGFPPNYPPPPAQ